jgi:hypothetical protein
MQPKFDKITNFLIHMLYLGYNGMVEKTISRYCPFKKSLSDSKIWIRDGPGLLEHTTRSGPRPRALQHLARAVRPQAFRRLAGDGGRHGQDNALQAREHLRTCRRCGSLYRYEKPEKIESISRHNQYLNTYRMTVRVRFEIEGFFIYTQ